MSHRTERIALGIALRLGSMTVFAFMGGLVKWAGEQGTPLLEILFFRNAFAFLPLCLFIWGTTGFSVLKTRRPLSHLLRSGIGIVAMGCNFTALILLPLAEATALSFTAPLFMTALSVPVLKEKVGVHRWSAVAVGFVGVLIMIQPDPQHMAGVGVAVALAGAFVAACATVTVRQIAKTETGPAIVFYFSLAGTALSLCGLPFGWILPSPTLLGVLVLTGVLGGMAQHMMTEALAKAPIAVLAPFDYTQLVWASLIGYFVWHQAPRATTIAGAVVVAASGIYIVYREVRRAREARQSQTAPSPL